MLENFNGTEILDVFAADVENIVAQTAVFDHGVVTVIEKVNAHEIGRVSLSPTAALQLYEEMKRRLED